MSAAVTDALQSFAPAQPASSPSSLILRFAPSHIAINGNDVSAVDWLRELFAPHLTALRLSPRWRLTLQSSAAKYLEYRERRPAVVSSHPCFIFDQQVLELPAWPTDRGIAVEDAERACFFHLGRRAVRLIADPKSRRWRFTMMRLVNAIATTRMRRAQLDMHAAAVESDGRAILISGPKRAGKTTLALHLLRAGRCRMIANDRAFIGRARGAASRFEVHGVPTIVKIRPATLSEFPELYRQLPNIERPYLYTLDELARMPANSGPIDLTDFALSPAQLAHRLDVSRLNSAPLGALIFPRICSESDGWSATRLSPIELRTLLRANFYGASAGRHAPTLFEQAAGGLGAPSSSLIDAIADTVAGYRVTLGRFAYTQPDFTARLLERCTS